MSFHVIDDVNAISALVDSIATPEHKPLMFVDLEGINLSRHGSIAIMQVLVPPSPTVHLVDVLTLRTDAFTTPGNNGSTLSSLLQDGAFAKVFFDVRNDSDALYSLFGIEIQGVIDLQLVEFATRRVKGRFLKGLAKCVAEDASLEWRERSEWNQIKQAGHRLFAPEQGGSYEVFLERPLPSAVLHYCAQDVSMMPKLLSTYGVRLTSVQAMKIHAETLERIVLSQSRDFNGKGRHMAVGPLFRGSGSHSGSEIPFPMSLVRSEQLSLICMLDETPSLRVARPDSAIDEADAARPARGETSEERVGAQSPAAESSGSASATTSIEPGIMTEALQISMARAAQGTRRYEDSSDDGLGHYGYGGSYRGSEEERDGGDDFTACSLDDCGYCGRCMY